MRKVLLATTALVAMSVTAAQADISIGGSMEFDYTNTDGTVAVARDGNLTITASSTADNGITYGVTVNNHIDLADAVAEDAFISVAGDFGKFVLGKNDNASENMDGSLGKNMDIHSSGAQASTSTVAAVYDDGISYYSPNVNGFAVGYSMQPENAGASSYIVTYSGNGIHAHFAGNDADATQMGVSFSMSGATIAIGSGDDGSASNSKSTDIGVKYALNDTTTLGMMSASKQGGAKYQNIGAKVTLGGGAYTMIEYSSGKASAGATVNTTFLSLGVAF
jgi:hypothetical protein